VVARSDSTSRDTRSPSTYEQRSEPATLRRQSPRFLHVLLERDGVGEVREHRIHPLRRLGVTGVAERQYLDLHHDLSGRDRAHPSVAVRAICGCEGQGAVECRALRHDGLAHSGQMRVPGPLLG